MTDLPPPPSLHDLSRAEPLALFLDFDGTLVDIAPTPDAIHVPADLAHQLHRLNDRLGGRLALVSGRAIADLERHLGGLAIACAGSHGSECRSADGSVIGDLPVGLSQAVLEQVAEFVGRHGLTQEDKPHGAALHYRAVPALEDKALAFARKLAEAHDLAVKRGKCVVELVASGANKGSAVHALSALEPFAAARPVFIGDDVTDEDGMAAAKELGGFGVVVGERPSTNASYGLATPAAVQHWLGL